MESKRGTYTSGSSESVNSKSRNEDCKNRSAHIEVLKGGGAGWFYS